MFDRANTLTRWNLERRADPALKRPADGDQRQSRPMIHNLDREAAGGCTPPTQATRS